MSTWEPSDQSPFTARPYDWQADEEIVPTTKPARWRSWRVVSWLYRGYAFYLVRIWHLRRRLRASTRDRFDVWRHARWIDGDFAGLQAVIKCSAYSSVLAAVAISGGLVLGSRLGGRNWMLEYYYVPLLLGAAMILSLFWGYFVLKESVTEYGRRYTLYRISEPDSYGGSE
jgi:hypothetical protein